MGGKRFRKTKAKQRATGNPNRTTPAAPAPNNTQPRTFLEKIWVFIEGPLAQTGVAIVLLVVGALLSFKMLMVAAFFVFMIAAYRAGLFEHSSKRYRVASYFGVPTVTAGVLVTVWLVVIQLKGTSSAETSPTPPPMIHWPTPSVSVPIVHTPYTTAQKDAAAKKIVNAYFREHHSYPSTEYINSKLYAEGYWFWLVSFTPPTPKCAPFAVFKDSPGGTVENNAFMTTGGCGLEFDNSANSTIRHNSVTQR